MTNIANSVIFSQSDDSVLRAPDHGADSCALLLLVRPSDQIVRDSPISGFVVYLLPGRSDLGCTIDRELDF